MQTKSAIKKKKNNIRHRTSWVMNLGKLHEKYYDHKRDRYNNDLIDALWILYRSKYGLQREQVKTREKLYEYMKPGERDAIIEKLIVERVVSVTYDEELGYGLTFNSHFSLCQAIAMLHFRSVI